eukprot:TRINITY_DN1274_c0_g1_i1.p1 TRINITY_DN1274_c0_g1~~TRINITY_DN1274_c0_g1_i1.p1  ORF type:complete len:146 (+),score=3.80 TRINITY_DN1274_c0_g1_i1:646-1083(+)
MRHMGVRSSHPRGFLRLASCIRVILLVSLLSPLRYAGCDALVPPNEQLRPDDGSHSPAPVESAAPVESPSPPVESPSPPVESPTPSSAPSSPSRSGLTSGAKAGLGLISVAGLLQVAVFFFLMAKRRQLLRDVNYPGDWSPARDL